MGQRYLYSTISMIFILGVLHIHGARAIIPLFCNHQDNESESQ